MNWTRKLTAIFILCGLGLFISPQTTQAQIALLDGPSAIAHGTSTNISSPSFTVSSGASVMVVSLADHNVDNGEPSTLSWNGQTLSQAVTIDNAASTYRDSAIYYLFNPTPGSGAITGITSAGVDNTWLSAFTLTGVSTNYAPLTGSVNSSGATIISNTVAGVPTNSWAAVNTESATTGIGLGITDPNGGTVTTTTDNGDDTTTVTMGYVTGLPAGNNTFVATAGNSQKMGMVEAIFAVAGTLPGAPTAIRAVAGPKLVNLDWNAGPGATSYHVKRSTISGGETTVATVTNSYYIDTGLANGTTYYYKVSGVNSDGESANSSEASATPAAGGTWTKINSPPSGLDDAHLMSDGTVLCGQGGTAWYKLTPDIHGSYINGTWTQIASTTYSRLFYSTQVLTNGNLYVAGGEDGTGNFEAELYTPLNNVWTVLPLPMNPPYSAYSDAVSSMLPNGNVVQGTTSVYTYIYNVGANTMTVGTSSMGNQNETCWVRMPNDNILMVDAFGQKSEHYVPSLGKWYADGQTPINLYGYGGELGAAFAMPNGTVFQIGASAYTAIYTPGGSLTAAGSWVSGPPMTFGGNAVGAVDAPSAEMLNGKVLCALSPVDGYNGPSYFYEYDYVSNTFAEVNGPGGTLTDGNAAFVETMLDLPDGTVLMVNGQGVQNIWDYKSTGTPLAAAQPGISNITENADGSFHLTGMGLHGISGGAAYGDDWQMITSFPLVRMTNNSSGNVYYARTHDWSSTTIQNTNPVTTEFTLPTNLPNGTYSLVVVVNGDPSAPVLFTNALANGSPTNFTLNYGGLVVVQPSGNDWNTITNWNPGGQGASTTAASNPGSTYEIVTSSRLRSPSSGNAAFPGTTNLVIDGDGVYENNALVSIGELRIKHNGFNPATNYYANLVLNGGEVLNGDIGRLVFQGQMSVQSNSVFYIDSATDSRSEQIDSWLTGSGNLFFHDNAFGNSPANDMNITGTTNTFNGQWIVDVGALLGSGSGSLGTNNISVGTNGLAAAVETLYDLNDTNASLTLGANGRVYLHKTNHFASVTINGTSLTNGTYSFTQLNGVYPANFPSTWTQLVGSGASVGSGQIIVGSVPPSIPHITSFNLTGTTLTISATNGAANGTYYLLMSTNVALPISQWTSVLTNTFDGGGDLNLSTNIVHPDDVQEFYILQVAQ
jgi:hypothetical protein